MPQNRPPRDKSGRPSRPPSGERPFKPARGPRRDEAAPAAKPEGGRPGRSRPEGKKGGPRAESFKGESRADGAKGGSRAEGFRGGAREEGARGGPRPEGARGGPRPEGFKGGPRPEGFKGGPRPEGFKGGPRPEGQQDGTRSSRTRAESRQDTGRPGHEGGFDKNTHRRADAPRPDSRPASPVTETPVRAESPAPRRDAGRPRTSEKRAPAVPAGAVWLYGTHAVAAALQNPERQLRQLLITEEAQAALAAEAPLPWPLQPEITTREKIDHVLGARPGSGIVHQGIALLADQLDAPELAEATLRPGPVLVLDQIFDPRNVGALMRTAQAFGACAVIAQDRNAPEETGALAKAASGALETIPLLRLTNISRALIALKAADFWVVGLDGQSPTPLRGAAFAGRRVALVLGSEGEGMRRLTRETCDEICALSMPGGMESLNVSAAGAVALYELTRQP